MNIVFTDLKRCLKNDQTHPEKNGNEELKVKLKLAEHTKVLIVIPMTTRDGKCPFPFVTNKYLITCHESNKYRIKISDFILKSVFELVST